MTEIAIVVVIAALVVAVVAFLLGRVGRASGEMVGTDREDAEPVRARPKVADFHVRGEEAAVYFEVPLGSGEVDPVLRDLLVHEAVEVVREKRHTLPIEEATRVVAYGRRDGEFVEAGHVRLSEPGELPPPLGPPTMPRLRKGRDPLEEHFGGDLPSQAPGLAETRREEELGPAGGEIRIPGSVEAGLRAQGVDPSTASAGELVVALLELAGYTIQATGRENTYHAQRGGARTFVRVVPHQAGGYPELGEQEVDQFMVDFVSSGAQRGLLVTDKYGPFGIYERERRQPKVRFITRERLQNFVEALTVG